MLDDHNAAAGSGLPVGQFMNAARGIKVAAIDVVVLRSRYETNCFAQLFRYT